MPLFCRVGRSWDIDRDARQVRNLHPSAMKQLLFKNDDIILLDGNLPLLFNCGGDPSHSSFSNHAIRPFTKQCNTHHYHVTTIAMTSFGVKQLCIKEICNTSCDATEVNIDKMRRVDSLLRRCLPIVEEVTSLDLPLLSGGFVPEPLSWRKNGRSVITADASTVLQFSSFYDLLVFQITSAAHRGERGN
jgi:hypothetical protein